MIDALFLLKPLADMLWQYKIFNLSLILGIGFVFILNFPKIKFTFASSLFLLVYLLFIKSFLLDISQETIGVFLKLSSAFLLFYLAQFNKDPQKTLKILAFSFLFPVALTVIMAITGSGYVYWGTHLTFSGPYFYKTDMAISIVLSSIFFRYFLYYSNSQLIKMATIFYLFIVAPWLIYIANSRMLMVVYLFIFIFLLLELLSLNKVKISRGIKTAALAILLVFSIVAFNFYNAMASAEGLLSISLEGDAILSQENTQGRNGIWESILSHFFKGSPSEVLFGMHLNADTGLNAYLKNDAHNTFLKVLVTTGITGLLIYLISLMHISSKTLKFRLAAENNSEYAFLSNTIIFVLALFILCGITQSNIIYTQSSWYAFYFMGLLFNPNVAMAYLKKI